LLKSGRHQFAARSGNIASAAGSARQIQPVALPVSHGCFTSLHAPAFVEQARFFAALAPFLSSFAQRLLNQPANRTLKELAHSAAQPF
jgi:hypothetical protein